MSPAKTNSPSRPRILSVVLIGLLVGIGLSLPRGGSSGIFQLAPGVSVKNVLEPFDYFKNSWAVTGLMDYPEATRISPDGKLFLGDGSACQLLVGENFVPLDNRVKKTLKNGYVPIVHYQFILNGSVEYQLEILACPIDSEGDSGFSWPYRPNYLNLVRLIWRNLTDATQSAGFGLSWAAGNFLKGKDLSGENEWGFFFDDRLAAALNSPLGSHVSTSGARIAVQTSLTAHERETVSFAIPHYALAKPTEREATKLARLDFVDMEGRTMAFWEGLLGRGANIGIPEAKPFESYLASLVYQFIGRDKAEIHGGEGFHDEFHLHDGAYQAVSLAQAGYLEEARKSLEVFPRYQQDNGQFLSHDNSLDGNGYAVWAMVEYALLSGDKGWLEKKYPLIKEAVAFVREARRKETDPRSPFFGILPSAPADGETPGEGSYHIVGNDLWNLRAVMAAADAARFLGRTDDAKFFTAEFEDYRSAIFRALSGTGLPYIPSSYEKGGAFAGNLEVIFPTGLVRPLDRRFSATLGNISMTSRSIGAFHPYEALLLTNSYLIRDEQQKALEGFYSFLLHSTSTQGFADGIARSDREAHEDELPHLRAAALYITTLRNMLVREEDDNLHIFSAIPPDWFEPGRKIHFEGAPTRFGKISLAAECQDDAIFVAFTRPERMDPERVLIHLPQNLEVTSIGTCGRTIKMSMVREVFVPKMNLMDINVLSICIRRKPKTFSPTFASKVAEYLATPTTSPASR